MKTTSIGVDVASNELVAYRSHDQQTQAFPNDEEGIKQLINWAQQYDHELKAVVFEASGGYELDFGIAAWEAGLPVFRANPRLIRDLAKAHQKLAKTDAIDAVVLALAGEQLELPPFCPATSQEQQLRELVKRRKDLVDDKTREKQRERMARGAGKASLKRHITWLEEEIKQLEREINELLNSKTFDDTRDTLTSVPGVGNVVAATLMAQLPELGELSSRQLSALVGVAPFCSDSGTHRGKRRIWGGRAEPRRALYIAAQVASRCSPTFKRKREEMEKRGKPLKVILVAIARKLLHIMNTLLRKGTKWEENYQPNRP